MQNNWGNCDQIFCYPISWLYYLVIIYQWIGLREILQESPIFQWENLWFPVDFPLNQSIEYSYSIVIPTSPSRSSGSHGLPSNSHCECTRHGHGSPRRRSSGHRRAAWRQGGRGARGAQRRAHKAATGHGKAFHGQNLGNLGGLDTKLLRTEMLGCFMKFSVKWRKPGWFFVEILVGQVADDFFGGWIKYICCVGYWQAMIALRSMRKCIGTIEHIYIYTQCEAPKIAKLVFNSNNYVTMVYGIYNYSYWGL